jgi:hypothetical protein
MDNLHFFLCPHVPFSKILERVETIMKQMGREVSTSPYGIEDYRSIYCSICKNKDERFTVLDDNQGMMICLGRDGHGCGNVLVENMMKEPYHHLNLEENPFEMFSPQAQFRSELASDSNRTQRLNYMIETNLSRYGRDDTVTSDHYKDKQRLEAYAILDQVMLNTTVDHDVVNKVKMLFHQYRTKMYRIHKLENALLALFYIVLNNKL